MLDNHLEVYSKIRILQKITRRYQVIFINRDALKSLNKPLSNKILSIE